MSLTSLPKGLSRASQIGLPPSNDQKARLNTFQQMCLDMSLPNSVSLVKQFHEFEHGGNVQQAAPESLDIQRRMLNMVK